MFATSMHAHFSQATEYWVYSGMTYPISFRRHALAVRESEGLTFSQAATRFSVGIASLVRWSKEIEPRPYRNYSPPLCGFGSGQGGFDGFP